MATATTPLVPNAEKAPLLASEGQRSTYRGGCDAFRMVFFACILSLMAVGAFVLIVLEPPTDGPFTTYGIVVTVFLVLAQLPFLSSIVFTIFPNAGMGKAHMGITVAVTVLMCCGLITNVRVMKESDLSEYCEKHLGHCQSTVDFVTFTTLLLISVCAVIGILSAFFAYRIVRKIRVIVTQAPAPVN